ncbi:MAG: acyltransferase [Candidatus Geothermincolia bacterium]
MRLPQGWRIRLNAFIRKHKSPRMLRGYLDPAGSYRPDTRVSDTCVMHRPENIFIGDNVYVGHFTVLDGTEILAIGEGTQISAWAGVLTHSSHVAVRLYGRHYLEVPESEKKGYRAGPVTIGRYVFIGVGAKVLSGVTIGNGALVTPGSMVRADVPAFAIVSGDPAEVVGDTRELDKPYLEQEAGLRDWYAEWQEAD